MRPRFASEAREELLAAIWTYEREQPRLGRRFKDEFEQAVSRICQNPGLYRLRPGSYRRVNLRVFPYYIAYVVRGETLWIVAVAHARRRPHYWAARKPEWDG